MSGAPYALSRRVGGTLRGWRAAGLGGWARAAASLLPILSWLPAYRWRSHAHHDLIAGLTVGIVNVPQGMAYGLLAGLSPVQGLYTSMVFPFVYTFFGTSRHAAIGTFAVTSIMTNDVVSSYFVEPGAAHNASSEWNRFWCGLRGASPNGSSPAMAAQQADLAVTLCFLVALIHLAFGLLRFGFLTVLLSDQLIQGLTTGAAFHVLTSQVKYIFGLDHELSVYQKEQPDILPLPRFYVCFLSELFGGFDWQPFVVSLICIIVLVIVKLYIDPKTRPKLHFPIPIELILVIITTGIAFALKLPSTQLSVVGNVTAGFPAFRAPDLSYVDGSLIGSAFTISIMLYSIEVSIAKLFAEKNHYRVDPNQEWIGLGMAHLVGSFFGCLPGGASMSRSMVQGSQGCKSPLVNLINSIIIFVVLMGVANLFWFLPECTLSAIIVVSLKSLFLQFNSLPLIFRKSKTDFVVWVGTFAATALSTVKVGLFFGVGLSLGIVVYRAIWPTLELRPSKRGLVLRFSAAPSFLNVERLRDAALRALNIDLLESGRQGGDKTTEEAETGTTRLERQAVIVDCSGFSFLDMMGAQLLLQLYRDFEKADIQMTLRGLSPECLEILKVNQVLGDGKIPTKRLANTHTSGKAF